MLHIPLGWVVLFFELRFFFTIPFSLKHIDVEIKPLSWWFVWCGGLPDYEHNRHWRNTYEIADYAELHRFLMTYFTNWHLVLISYFHLCRETELVEFVYCNNNLFSFLFQLSKYCLGIMETLAHFRQHVLSCFWVEISQEVYNILQIFPEKDVEFHDWQFGNSAETWLWLSSLSICHSTVSTPDLEVTVITSLMVHFIIEEGSCRTVFSIRMTEVDIASASHQITYKSYEPSKI